MEDFRKEKPKQRVIRDSDIVYPLWFMMMQGRTNLKIIMRLAEMTISHLPSTMIKIRVN